MSTALVPSFGRALENLSSSDEGFLVRPDATLAELVEPFCGWLRVVRGRAEHTVVAYRKDVTTFARFCEQGALRRPAQVHRRVIEGYLAALHHRHGLTATTANRHRHALGTFWKFLRREELVTGDPVADTFGFKEPRRLPKYLTIPEQERVLEVLGAAHGPPLRPHHSHALTRRRDHALIATALFTGLRVEELATLRLEAVDLPGRRLRVTGKGNKEREAVIIPRLGAILRAYLCDVRPRCLAGGASPWMFPRVTRHGVYRGGRFGRERPLLTRSVYALVHRVLSPIVGRPVFPHMLRHSFASRLRENGAGIELIQEALGHADIRTTTIYSHLTSAKRMADIERYLS